MKYLVILFFSVLFPVAALAQSPADTASKYGITFPIAQLGNCSSLSDCRAYCEDPLHHDACIAFAKQKGFYHEPGTSAILQQAQTELGCDSKNACRQLCEQPANHDKCSAFAKEHGLAGGQTQDPSKGEILQKAEQSLGCDSYESCRSFCEQSVNADRCSQFARQAGLEGGRHSEGPGGCTSQETCRQFCDQPQNFQTCQTYSQAQGTGQFSGPGGCNSESSCRSYCQAHPAECGGPPETNMTRPTPYATSYPAYTPSAYTPPPGYDPATQCATHPGCSWTGSTCQCSSSPPQPTSTNSPTESAPAATAYPSQPDPATECAKHSGCTWTGSYCQCVQGANTTRGAFPALWQCLFGQ